MKAILRSIFILSVFSAPVFLAAQEVPLEQKELVSYLDSELSGESAKRNLEFITTLHRMRGSDDYNKAIAFLTGKLHDYHLEAVEVIRIPADGKTMYGTHKTRPAWNSQLKYLPVFILFSKTPGPQNKNVTTRNKPDKNNKNKPVWNKRKKTIPSRQQQQRNSFRLS